MSAPTLAFFFGRLSVAELALLKPPYERLLSTKVSDPGWRKSALKTLETLIIFTRTDYFLSQSFSEFVFGSFIRLQRFVVVMNNFDLRRFIDDYIQSGVSKNFVHRVQLQSYVNQDTHVTPAPVPSLRAAPVETALTAKQIFKNGLLMQDAVCHLFTFKNQRRQDTLYVYVANALLDPSSKKLDGSPYPGHFHAYCLVLQ